MDLFVFRHAQGHNNLPVDTSPISPDEVRRRLDAPLTDLGRRQAHLLADWVADRWSADVAGTYGKVAFFFSHLYASPMQRTAETAGALSVALDLPIIFEPLTHECGGLSFKTQEGAVVTVPGLHRAYFEENYPGAHIPEAITPSGWWARNLPETPEDWDDRADRWLESVTEAHDEDAKIALVTHQGFFQAICRRLLRINGDVDASPLWFTLFNTGAAHIRLGPDEEVSFRFVNQLAHLPPQMITG